MCVNSLVDVVAKFVNIRSSEVRNWEDERAYNLKLPLRHCFFYTYYPELMEIFAMLIFFFTKKHSYIHEKETLLRATLFERLCILSKYKIRALCWVHCVYGQRCKKKTCLNINRAHTTKTRWDVVVLIKFTVRPFKRPLRRVEQYRFATVLWPITLKHFPPIV